MSDIADVNTGAKKPGRPPKQTQPSAIKKGNPTWKPASLNEFSNKEPGYRYRMVRKDPNNLAKKQAEQWESVSSIQSANTKHLEPGRIEDGKPLTSVQEGKDWILQRIPEGVAKERDAYIDAENERRIAGLTAHIKKEAEKEGAATHGNITISSRKGTQVIE